MGVGWSLGAACGQGAIVVERLGVVTGRGAGDGSFLGAGGGRGVGEGSFLEVSACLGGVGDGSDAGVVLLGKSSSRRDTK